MAFKEISSQSAVRFNSICLLSNNSRLQHDSGNENSRPTHAQIDFQTRGEHGSLLCPVFSVGGFDTDQMATLKPLMMWRFPAVGSSAWLHIISKLGPTAGQAFPQWGPFHQPCIYSSLWLTPRPARGLCSVCQPCWEGSVAQRAVIHQASVSMCVCTCCTLLCFSSRWGASAEGTKWSQASCSNRPEEQALGDWGQCVNAGLCAAVGVRTCCMCARFITF